MKQCEENNNSEFIQAIRKAVSFWDSGYLATACLGKSTDFFKTMSGRPTIFERIIIMQNTQYH